MRKATVLSLMFLAASFQASVAIAECRSVPVGDVVATPTEVFNPSGKPMELVIEGRFIQPEGCTFQWARFTIVDEYNEMRPGGGVVLDGNGSFRFPVTLEAKVRGKDLNGRRFIVNVSAMNEAGPGVASNDFRLLHDPHHTEE